MTTTDTVAPGTPARSSPEWPSDPELINDAEHLAGALSDLIRVVQFRDRDRACCYDISVSQCYALKTVTEAGSATVNDLAAHLFLDKSTASRVANGLVAKGLLGKEKDVDDGRVVWLVATDEGRQVCSRIEDDLTREYAELLEDFEPKVRVAIARMITRLGRSFAARVETSGGSCCVVP